ncbi:hypothetical protein ACIP9H_40600 [Streptomyces sp. NPDC088732]|uniref:hypothetical protein n=1 Tax=Streptomyces sp. NPDC088732 TaxID=3365879 RepID=UPI00381A3ACC
MSADLTPVGDTGDSLRAGGYDAQGSMTIKVWKVAPGGERYLVSARVVGRVPGELPPQSGMDSAWPVCTCQTCTENAAS